MAAEPVTSEERARVEAFLYREARMMDAHDYTAWLGLFADDALYWIPSNRDDGDPTRDVSIVSADRNQLEFRIQRLASGTAWSQEPRSPLCVRRRLRPENGDFRIAWKKVELVDNDEVIDNLTFLV